jgi:hypothetical protein
VRKLNKDEEIDKLILEFCLISNELSKAEWFAREEFYAIQKSHSKVFTEEYDLLRKEARRRYILKNEAYHKLQKFGLDIKTLTDKIIECSKLNNRRWHTNKSEVLSKLIPKKECSKCQ